MDKNKIGRHKFMYHLIHLVSPLLLKKYHFRTEQMKRTKENYIVMANHATESDMIMMMRAFPQFMYFVCGEHLKRSKNAGLIWRYFDPIPEYKGSNAVSTVREIITRVKAGHNVMIFPEGSRSFHGETEPVSVATGKMVKVAGCGLVTYQIHGGYFIAPRWAYRFRKGPADGRIVGVYTKEQINAMTPQEITDIINRDLYVNAYELQRENPALYAGEVLAEGLENYLEICPECGAYDSMETSGDDFRCKCCDHGGTYTPEGFLRGEGLHFDSVYDWGKWMESRFVQDIRRRFETEPEEMPLFADEELELSEILPTHELVSHGFGRLTAYRDRLVFGDQTFRYDNIAVMSMLYYGKTLLFDYDKKHMSITGRNFHAWKYNSLHSYVHDGCTEA